MNPSFLLARRPMLWLAAIALLVLAGFSFSSLVSQREALHTDVIDDFEHQLRDRMTVWEENLLSTLSEILEQAAADAVNHKQLQARSRDRFSWFDSLYVWVPRRPAQLPGKTTAPRVVYPPGRMKDRMEVYAARRCVLDAKAMPAGSEPRAVAEAFVHGCRDENLPVRAYTSSEAATVLIQAGDFRAALSALSLPEIDDNKPLMADLDKGVTPFRRVVRRIQRSEALLGLERTDEALDLLYKTGRDICRLDAPEAESVLLYVRYPVLYQLRLNGRTEQMREIQSAIDQAELRLRALREITQRMLPQAPSEATEAARFVYDQYSDTPFLLYYGQVRNQTRGVALHVDQGAILEDFLRTIKRLRRYLVITDASGAHVAGSHTGGDVILEVPFSRTFTHLRIGLRQVATEARLDKLAPQQIAPLVITVVCLVLGFIALNSQAASARNRDILLQRQREFTTRVTHELKTPIAGIKVVAENLVIGAWKTPEERAAMAERIVDEADRLTLRVDEILAMGRNVQMPDPEPFDPEEIVFECIDSWGPRFEQAGVKLVADLHPTDEILGNARAVRDAVSCLLDNALKYHDPKRRPPTVWLKLYPSGRKVHLEVTDNGIGVPAGMRGQIFDRFVRVEGPGRGKSGGHGLGLAQVAAIAKRHRGDVVCTDGVDGGSSFVIRLPTIR